MVVPEPLTRRRWSVWGQWLGARGSGRRLLRSPAGGLRWGMPCRPWRGAGFRLLWPPRHPLRSRRRHAPSAAAAHTRSRLRSIWWG